MRPKRYTRILALINADGRCQKCGGVDKLTQHHIKPLRHKGVRYDSKNVRILCRDCHDEIEIQIREQERQALQHAS